MGGRLTLAKIEPLAVGEQREGVWRRSADTYVVALRIDGKRHQRSFGSDYEAAAMYAKRLQQEEKLRKLKGHNPILDQIVRSNSSITIGDVLINYVGARAPFLKSGTVEFYRYLMNRLIPLQVCEAETITHSEITNYIGALKSEGLSNKIIRELISFCKSAYKLAIEQELIAPHRNMFVKIKPPAADRFEPHPFSAAEVKAIFDELNPQMRLMFWTQFTTGLRSGELIALKFGDLNYERSRISVKRTKRHGVENAPKTKSSVREVYMPPVVAEALGQLQKSRKATDKEYIFLTQYQKPYDDIPHVAWKQAVERAGVDYRRCYTLRHTFASQALSNNVRLSYVSEALGHTSINITATKYARHMPDKNQEDEQKLIRLTSKVGAKTKTVRRTDAALGKKGVRKAHRLAK